jgi:serine/threonine protein kinase/tetratricopeptide (TPR) repeat protein
MNDSIVAIGSTLDGAYRLEEEVGRGSMGVVYRATDINRQFTVAVKIMRTGAATDRRFRRLFRREARAMARLNHPGIVEVYGYGITEDDRPYLVMELVEGRGLHTLSMPSRLSFVVTLIDRILEALAHAHARGVIHRDLKPANVLLAADADDTAALARGTVKIVDFGIARIFNTAQSRSDPKRLSFAQVAAAGYKAETRPHEVRLEGTPRYIAPELYRGQEGVISPANDIYALGVILWEFICGKPVFDAENEAVLVALQIRGDIPECIPRPALGSIEPPTELLRAMLHPDPLVRLDHATEVRRRLSDWYREQAELRASSFVPSLRSGEGGAAEYWKNNDPLNETRTAPSSARAASEPEINLLSWRPMPIYGRAREQTWLWQFVEQLATTNGAAVCVLEGEPGIGKTHLARWLVETAYEGGGVQPHWCGLSSATTVDALRSLLDHHFFTTGLKGELLGKRLKEYLQQEAVRGAEFVVSIEKEASRIQVFLRPELQSPSTGSSDSDTTQRRSLTAMTFDVGEELAALISRIFERAAVRRPALVVFDGVETEHAHGVLRLVDHIMRSQRARGFPVLFVITAVRGILDELHGSARAALDYLAGTHQLHRLAIGPLGDIDLQTLLQRFESLDDSTRVRVTQRSDGNPLFALELAGQALRAEMTDSSEQITLSTPAGIRELWRRRVSIIASGSPIGGVAVRLLEFVAVLGSPLWMDLLNTGWNAPELDDYRSSRTNVSDAWDLWIDARVLSEDQGFVSFRHAILRDTLLDEIQGQARTADYHAAAARARRQLGLIRTPREWLRMAEHLFEAGQLDEAWPFALGAAQRLLLAGELESARKGFTRCEQIIEGVGAGPDDMRREPLDVGFAELSWRLGDPQEAQRRAQELCARAHRTGSMRLLGRGELLLAELALQNTTQEEASELFDRALARFETSNDDAGRADCLSGIGRLALRSGRIEVARRNLLHAQQIMRTRDNDEGLGQVGLLLAETSIVQGNMDAAQTYLAEARAAFERSGNSLGASRAIADSGHIAQARGEMAEAAEIFQLYLERAESLGDIPAAAQARANLAHARVHLGDYLSATDLLLHARRSIEDLNDRASLAIIESILVGALARLGHWEDARAMLASAMETIHSLDIYDIDIAESLELAADTDAARDGMGPQFVVLIEEAARQWRNLGRLERAHKLLGRHTG